MRENYVDSPNLESRKGFVEQLKNTPKEERIDLIEEIRMSEEYRNADIENKERIKWYMESKKNFDLYSGPEFSKQYNEFIERLSYYKSETGMRGPDFGFDYLMHLLTADKYYVTGLATDRKYSPETRVLGLDSTNVDLGSRFEYYSKKNQLIEKYVENELKSPETEKFIIESIKKTMAMGNIHGLNRYITDLKSVLHDLKFEESKIDSFFNISDVKKNIERFIKSYGFDKAKELGEIFGINAEEEFKSIIDITKSQQEEEIQEVLSMLKNKDRNDKIKIYIDEMDELNNSPEQTLFAKTKYGILSGKICTLYDQLRAGWSGGELDQYLGVPLDQLTDLQNKYNVILHTKSTLDLGKDYWDFDNTIDSDLPSGNDYFYNETLVL